MTSRLDFPWTLVLAAFALWATAGASGHSQGVWAATGAGVARGELWRLVTGPFIHATWGHLLRDLALCVAIGAAYEAPLRRAFPRILLVTLVASSAAALAVGWDRYLGLSGVSHGLMAAAIVYELRHRPRVAWYIAAAGIALASKVIAEAALGAPLFAMDLGPGVRQAPIAHAAGVVAGTLTVWQVAPSRPGSSRRALA